jgi:hypothetical protein
MQAKVLIVFIIVSFLIKTIWSSSDDSEYLFNVKQKKESNEYEVNYVPKNKNKNQKPQNNKYKRYQKKITNNNQKRPWKIVL